MLLCDYPLHILVVQVEIHDLVDQLQHDNYLHTVSLWSLQHHRIDDLLWSEMITADLIFEALYVDTARD